MFPSDTLYVNLDVVIFLPFVYMEISTKYKPTSFVTSGTGLYVRNPCAASSTVKWSPMQSTKAFPSGRIISIVTAVYSEKSNELLPLSSLMSIAASSSNCTSPLTMRDFTLFISTVTLILFILSP